MNLRRENLVNCFTQAEKLNYTYVAVAIDIQGNTQAEIIINHKDNFEAKLNYYLNAYDENLILNADNRIRIVGFTMTDTFEQVEEDLAHWISQLH